MTTLAAVAALLAGVLHVAFFVLESVLWTRPHIWPRFGVRSQSEADVIRPMALNQGFYNLFLAVGAVTGAVLLFGGHDVVGRTLVGFGCGCMLGAAVVLLVSNPKLARAAAVQGAFPLVAVVGGAGMSGQTLTVGGILFDLDGTLIDSTPTVERSWRKLADRIGISYESMNGSFHGVPSSQTIHRLLAGRPQAEIDDTIRWLGDVEVADTDGIVVLPGARELLDRLPAQRWGIVTSGSNLLATTRLRVAGLPQPRHFVTADDIARGKPFPDPYLLGAARLGLPPQRCLVVEDAPAGVESGLASGAVVLGLRTTHDDLEVPADRGGVVDDLSDADISIDGDTFTVRLAAR